MHLAAPGLPPLLLATTRCSERPGAPCRLLRMAVKWVLAGSFLEVAVKQPLPPGTYRNGPKNKAHTQEEPEQPSRRWCPFWGHGLASPRFRFWPGCREDWTVVNTWKTGQNV